MRSRTFPALLGLTLLWVAVAPAKSLAQSEISVDLIMATGVENREPVGVGETFPSDVGKVFAWMRVTGAAGQAIQVVWSHGTHTFTVPLEIGGSPWRTWSSKTIPSFWSGEWSVEVRDAQGNSLVTTKFTVGG
jgi:hypothetical protein